MKRRFLDAITKKEDVIGQTKESMLSWGRTNATHEKGMNKKNLRAFVKQVEKAKTAQDLVKASCQLNLEGRLPRADLWDMAMYVRKTMSSYLEAQRIFLGVEGMIEGWCEQRKCKSTPRQRRALTKAILKSVVE